MSYIDIILVVMKIDIFQFQNMKTDESLRNGLHDRQKFIMNMSGVEMKQA